MEGVLRETESMLARGRMELPLTLGFAAQRGDDLLLQNLLKRGLDANEADNNGRTPLVSTHESSIGTVFLLFCISDGLFSQHLAASNGSENCVLLLLDYGADPNSRGIFPIQILTETSCHET